MGLVARHYLRHYPLRLPGLAGMGLSMVVHGRMGFIPHRIKRVDGLRAILAARGGAREPRRTRELVPVLPGLLA